MPNTCKSNGDMFWKGFGLEEIYFSGGRVSNAWAICLVERDNRPKGLLIPDELIGSHDRIRKGETRYKMSLRPIS